MDERVIDDIRRASRAGYTSSVDVVDLLSSSGWSESADLCAARIFLKETDDLKAITFFQLPYRLAISGAKRFSVQWENGEPTLTFNTRAFGKGSGSEGLQNQLTDLQRIAEYTQVQIAFSLWGARRKYYEAYLNEISGSVGHSRKHLVKAEASWRPGRPMTAETYESDLCSRLYHESVQIMKQVLRTYSTLARDPNVEPLEALPNFFVMAKNGRLILRPKHESAELEIRQIRSARHTVKAADLVDALANKSKFSQYEQFLVDAVRHIEGGNPNLAIVQAVMILDWFANTILAERLVKPIRERLSAEPVVADFVVGKIWESRGPRSQIRVSTIDKFKEYFPLAGIHVPPQLLAQLKVLIAVRNDIVHKRQVDSVAENVARDAVSTAIEIVRHLMLQMKVAADMGQFE